MEQVYVVFSGEGNYLFREEEVVCYSHRAAFEYYRDLRAIGYDPLLQAFRSRKAFYEWKEKKNERCIGAEAAGQAAQGGGEKAADGKGA